MIVYIIKIPTELDKRVVGPIKADAQDYTVCKENESGYGGDYPLSYEIVNYYVPNPQGYIIVPYKSKRADKQYGFYEFNTKKELVDWFKKNRKRAETFLKSHPEYFI